MAHLLSEGAVMKTKMQPHEAHIPYLLQTFIDYNLFGMDQIHIQEVRLRKPLRSRDIQLPPAYSGRFWPSEHPYALGETTCDLELDAKATCLHFNLLPL